MIAQSPTENPEVQREATLQAAELYDKAGNSAKSRAMLEAFVKHFPQPLNPAMEARNKLSAIAQKSGDYTARDYWLKEIINADRARGRRERSQQGARGQGDLTLAGRRARVHAGQARRTAQEIPGRERKAMEAALKAYTQAADYQVAEVTTAATSRVPSCTALGKDLMSWSAPRGFRRTNWSNTTCCSRSRPSRSRRRPFNCIR